MTQDIGDDTAERSAEPLKAPAGEPAVRSLRLILLWPLGLAAGEAAEKPQSNGPFGKLAALLKRGKDSPSATMETEVRRLARAIQQGSGPWRPIADGLDHVRDRKPCFDADGLSPFPYAEYVYFHDFASRFLFAKHIPSALDETGAIPAFYLYANEALSNVTVTITRERTTLRFEGSVERANLYLFRTGVALLAVELLFETAPSELSGKNDRQQSARRTDLMSVDDVMQLSDYLRRAYVPAFASFPSEKMPPEWEPLGVPDSVAWSGLAPRSATTPTTLAATLRASLDLDARAAPLLPHWRELLPDALVVDGDGRRNVANLPTFRHLVDERMPLMSLVTLQPRGEHDNPVKTLSCGQTMRLCFVDSPGPKPLPYSASFLSSEHFEKTFCYDRFLDDGTRFLVTSYSFVLLTAEGSYASTITQHFRRMYFQIVMLSQFEYASLIAFSSRVSQAIEAADRAGHRLDPSFREKMLQIHEDFITFVHRFRFTGISNQVQARELHDKVRGAMGLAALFEDVKTEIEMGVSHLRATEEEAQTDAAARLNVILGLVAVLGLSFTGAQLFSETWWRLPILAAFLAILCVAMRWLVGLLNARTKRSPLTETMRGILHAVSAVSALVCAGSVLTLLIVKARWCT